MTTPTQPGEQASELLAGLTVPDPKDEDTGGMMHFKAALVERCGVEMGFEHFRTVVGDASMSMRRKPLNSWRDAGLRANVAFHELWPGGRTYRMPEPVVVGEGNHQAYDCIDRSAYLTCVPRATVRGRSAFVVTDEAALFDCEGDEIHRFRDRFHRDPAVFWAEHDEFFVIEGAAAEPLRVIEAISLVGTFSDNFGHWFLHHFPKYVTALMAGLPPELPVIIDDHLYPSQFEMLQLVRPPGAPLISLPLGAVVHAERLWLSPAPAFLPVFADDDGTDPLAWRHIAPEPRHFAVLMKEFLRRINPLIAAPTGKDRVFLSRGQRLRRRLINREEIESIADECGYVVALPEDLSIIEQIRLTHHARHIVAPEGSALMLGFLAQAGAKVHILNHRFTLPLNIYSEIFKALDVDCVILTGSPAGEDQPYQHWADYRIDGAMFRELVIG
jgi:capsular polysaccharide biosynthesis protein